MLLTEILKLLKTLNDQNQEIKDRLKRIESKLNENGWNNK